ncbi:octopamine receptor [Exaiptasia diaphana]|uniref:G-protein coupled receptors family 1 profile domain-containing protein n=1 Tax=Exaiptasia diaphana TaxID=2652724 RepID=A0A913WRV0_EXADI|nr:octopamine receptor [Exaiptasia diaphana]KXJ28064.1 Alpha-1A adrenergic receptor [Exaiptasia diaphana]
MGNETVMLYNHKLFNTTANTSSLVCGELSPAFTITGLTCMGTIVVLSVSGNSLVCFVIARFSRLRTISNYLVFSLAVSDMMVALSVLPFDIIYWVYFPSWPLGGYVCNLWNSSFFVFLTASVLNLLAICTDRFVAVVFALRYKDIMNTQIVKVIIAAIWAYSFSIGAILFAVLVPPQDHTYTFELHPAFHGFLLVGNVFVPFCIMIGLYFKIYLIARDHARRVGIISITSDLHVFDMIGRELRVAKTFGIVVVTFLLCWMPFEVINVAILIDEGVESCSMEIADTVSCWFAYLQIAANPAIYAFANSKFRKAFKRIICTQRNELDDSTLKSTNYREGDVQSVRVGRNTDQCSEQDNGESR